MHKSDIKLGSHYTAKVSGHIAIVQVQSESPYGGWNAVNIHTKRDVRIRSAARLRHEVARNAEGKWETAKEQS
jgi:hypothetical protein